MDKAYLEKLFNECRKYEFKNIDLDRIALREELDYSYLKSLLKKYIYEYMDADIREKYVYIKTLNLFLPYERIDINSLNLWKSNEEKREFLKKIYNLYMNSDTYELILKLMKELDLEENETKNLINESISKFRKRNTKDSNSVYAYFETFNFYVQLGNEKYILALVNKDNVQTVLEYFDMFLENYVKEKHRNKLKREVLLIIEKKLKKDSKNLNKAESLVKDYLSSGLIPDVYVKNNKMKKETFFKKVDIVRDNNIALYNQYLEIENEKAMEYKEIVLYILEEVGNRTFDIIDYYKDYNISFDELLYYINKMNLEKRDSARIKSYLKNNRCTKEWDEGLINEYYSAKIIVGVKTNNFGKILMGKELTFEDKEDVINYLKDNNIPIYQKTINAVHKRLFNEESKLVKKL